MKIIRSILLISIILMNPIAQAHIIYNWVDKDGIEHFTDEFSQIPIAYRDRVNILYIHEESTSPPVQRVKQREVNQKDIYGRDEKWWRDKSYSLKKLLKEAEENYEKAHEKFMQKAFELSRKRFGSPTQYKNIIIEMDQYKDEMVRYQIKISEIHEELKKLYKEAEASMANPEWVK